ncbi:MAG TPA: (Fe-S)-binding protein [bacterium]|nr:(Fe-S)-binding protein [bacterium]
MTRVALFVTCLIDQLFPHIGDATVRVLERAGCRVAFPPAQTCCGQATFNDGFWDEARTLARRFLDTFGDAEQIVTPSGSCAAMVREWYPQLFRDDPTAADRARAIGHRTYELSEFLVRVVGRVDVGARFAATVAYHPSCHGLRGLGLREEPRRLLEAVRDLRLVDLPKAEECCGFGGFFAVKFAALSGAMLTAKLDAIESSGAEVVTATDASCLMHIAGGLARRGSPVRALHLAELLASG